VGFLRQGGQSPAVIPQFTGLQIQTSSSAVPIEIMWGQQRTAPNIIWTGGFTAIPNYQKQGGKGGGKQLQGYNYFTGFAMGVCEGPIILPRIIYVNNNVSYFDQAGIDFAAYGGTPQAPWGYLAPFGQQSLGYNGLFYLGIIRLTPAPERDNQLRRINARTQQCRSSLLTVQDVISYFHSTASKLAKVPPLM
jgi:hypothetical protein